jgi:hypothetical protein
LNLEHEWLEPQTDAPGLPISLSFWTGLGEEINQYESLTPKRDIVVRDPSLIAQNRKPDRRPPSSSPDDLPGLGVVLLLVCPGAPLVLPEQIAKKIRSGRQAENR